MHLRSAWRIRKAVRLVNIRLLFRVDTSSDEAKTEGQIALLWLRAMATSDPDYVELIYDALLPHNIEVFKFGQEE